MPDMVEPIVRIAHLRSRNRPPDRADNAAPGNGMMTPPDYTLARADLLRGFELMAIAASLEVIVRRVRKRTC
jgi:hypothetical protein